MKFKDWLAAEGRFKGAQRIFNQQFAGAPKYVRDEFWNSRIAPAMTRTFRAGAAPTTSTTHDYTTAAGPAPTIAHTPQQMQQLQQQQQAQQQQSGPAPTIDLVPSGPSQSGFSAGSSGGFSTNPRSFKDFVAQNQSLLQGFQGKPVVVQVTPLDFDEETLLKFINWRFGYAPRNDLVKNDQERFDTQRAILATHDPGDNKPIILLKVGNKYRLLEGYHRAMAILVSAMQNNMGAPPEHIQRLASGKPLTMRDLAMWNPVPLKAYVKEDQPAA